MVDSHEHTEQRKHQKDFITEYIIVFESCCHRWMKVSIEGFESLPKRSDIFNNRFTYRCVDGLAMIEMHVDDHECLQTFASKKYGKFGGNVSVQSTAKPIITIEQDESIYNQFAFGTKQWVCSKD